MMHRQKMQQTTDHANRIKFLGTAGARYVMARQLRYSAGSYLELEGRKMLMDPGPGTLLRCARVRPQIDVTRLDAVLLSHAHIDHSGDVNAVIDAMTCGGWEKRGRLFAPGECLNGKNRILLDYISSAPEEVVELSGATAFEVDNLRFFTSVRHRHDVETYGFKFELGGGMLSFVTDTLYFDGLPGTYAGSRWLVINVVRASGYRGRKLKHMSLDEAETLIDAIRPDFAVLTHFGMSIVNEKPPAIARKMSKRLGVDVRAAHDGMVVELPKN